MRQRMATPIEIRSQATRRYAWIADTTKGESRAMRGSSKDGDQFLPLPEKPLLPLNVDRRSFLMRNAAIGAAAVMTGTVWTPEARAQQASKEAAAAPPLGGHAVP